MNEQLAIILRDLAMLARESRSSDVSAAEYVQHCEQVMQHIEKAFPAEEAPASFPIDKTDEWESRQDVAKQAKIQELAPGTAQQWDGRLDESIEIGDLRPLRVRAEKAEADARRLYEALLEAKEFIENQQLADGEWERILDVVVAAIAAHEETK